MSRRRGVRTPDLTSLFDVLFIMVFVSLVNAGVQKQRADEADAVVAAKSQPDAGAAAAVTDAGAPADAGPPPSYVALRDAALAALTRELQGRPAVIARVSKEGQLVAIEIADKRIEVGVPLVQRVADPDVGIAYLGERSPELRICPVLAQSLGKQDLSDVLVVIAPEVPVTDLAHALVAGLYADAARCLVDQRGAAVVVDPSSLMRGVP